MSPTTYDINHLNWNIQSGGFDDYDPEILHPTRGEAITKRIAEFREVSGISAVTLTDAYRWDDYYNGDSGIATHLGFREAHYVRLNDERLNRDNGAGIGIAFATDERVHTSKALDLETRQGLGVILDVGRYGLQIANVYLDYLDEGIRIRQVRALDAALESDIPTLAIGDFNGLRPNMRGASMWVRAKDLALRALINPTVQAVARACPNQRELATIFREMNRREIIRLMELLGYQDGDSTRKQPTLPARFPMLGIDYVFRRGRVSVSDVIVRPIDGESDHRPMTFRSTIAA
ncbi:MAG TPA: endonuclease/exonuclease/phosphatase family protein [Candidatus Saccharimonadales bacterium]|nr:endonuclease/exonuclease/phosphatase family protein [Candidatus Saccharimonadales bacterium]